VVISDDGNYPYIGRRGLRRNGLVNGLDSARKQSQVVIWSAVPCPPARVIRPEIVAMQAKPPLKIVLCSPRGFCAGVVRAIDTVERALAIYGAPVYVRHEIVHNRYVVDSLRTKGAIFVEELAEIPDNTNAPVVFSAHGVPNRCPRTPAPQFLFAGRDLPAGHQGAREAAIHFKRGREIC